LIENQARHYSFFEGESLVDHAGYMREALVEAEKAYDL
jgi:hypothetical protein